VPCAVHHRHCHCDAVALAICVMSPSSCHASQQCHGSCIVVVVTPWHWPSMSRRHHCHHHHCSRQPLSLLFSSAVATAIVMPWHWPSASSHCCRGLHWAGVDVLSSWHWPSTSRHVVRGRHRCCRHDTRHCVTSPSLPFLSTVIFVVVVVLLLCWRGWRFVQVAGCCGRGHVVNSAGRSSQTK